MCKTMCLRFGLLRCPYAKRNLMSDLALYEDMGRFRTVLQQKIGQYQYT